MLTLFSEKYSRVVSWIFLYIISERWWIMDVIYSVQIRHILHDCIDIILIIVRIVL